MALDFLLSQSATVLVESFAVDAHGEQVATTSTESAGLPCQVQPMRAEMKAAQGRDTSRRYARIYFDRRPFVEVDARNRLIVVDGQAYRPIDAHDQYSMGVVWQVDCVLVTG